MHTRTLRMADDVLAVVCSADGKVTLSLWPRAGGSRRFSSLGAFASGRLRSVRCPQLLAISLLDATVKVFYIDTLKFFLSLYGHKVRGADRAPLGASPKVASNA